MAKVIRAHSILGQQGINLLEEFVLSMGFVWRVKAEFDAGIDGEIEIRDPQSGAMSGCILNVQAKARSFFQSEDATSFEFPVDADDLDYWLNGNVPNILVVCRPATREAYWISIRDYFGEPKARKPRKVRFNKTKNRFDDNAAPALAAIARPKDCSQHVVTPRAAENPIPPGIQRHLDDARKLTDVDRFNDAIPILEKSLKAANRKRHQAAEAKIRTRLAHALFEGKEDSTTAEQHFRRALELAGKTPTVMQHSALHGLGDMLLWAGRLDEAGAVMHASLEVAKSIGRQDTVGRSLISLGLLEQYLGNAQAARDRLEEALRIFHQESLRLEGEEREENAHALAVCYQNKAQLERDDGRIEDALSLREGGGVPPCFRRQTKLWQGPTAHREAALRERRCRAGLPVFQAGDCYFHGPQKSLVDGACVRVRGTALCAARKVGGSFETCSCCD
jgi:tetratricopeptide (TPR) repeat protein